MTNIIDQGDDGDFTVEGEEAKARWYQNHLRTMGGWPSEEEEPTIEQLSALNKRLTVQDIAAFTGFAIFVPFGQRVARASKFRTYVLSAGGYTVKELPIPASFIQWRAAFRVLRTALIMLDAVGLANLHGYEMVVERCREIVSPLPCLLAFGAQCGRAGKISPLKSPEIKNADGHKGRKDATPYLGRSEAVGLGVWDAFSRHGVLAYPSARTRTGMDGKRLQGHPKHACGDGGGGLFARGLGRNHPRSGTVEVGPIENFQVNEQNENQKGCQEEEGGRGQGRAHEVQGEDGQERQEGFHGSSKVLWLEQWKWSLLGAAAWATVLVQDSTPSSLHYLRFTWPSLEELSKRQEERMKQHGKEGSSRRSRSPRRNREDPNRGKPYPKGEEHQHHQIDPEDLLTRLRPALWKSTRPGEPSSSCTILQGQMTRYPKLWSEKPGPETCA